MSNDHKCLYRGFKGNMQIYANKNIAELYLVMLASSAVVQPTAMWQRNPSEADESVQGTVQGEDCKTNFGTRRASGR